MRTPLLIMLLLLLAANFAHADREHLPSSEQAVGFGNRLMIDISRGKLSQAWRKLKANSVIPADRVDAFAAEYEHHLAQTIQHLGQPLGVEFVAQEAFGRSLLRVTYLMKYNVSSVAWYIYFYRIDDLWIISEFNYDLNSNSLFRMVNTPGSEAIRMYPIQAWQERVDRQLATLQQALDESRLQMAEVPPAEHPPALPAAPAATIPPRADPGTLALLAALENRIGGLEASIASPVVAEAGAEDVTAERSVRADSLAATGTSVTALEQRISELEASIEAYDALLARVAAVEQTLAERQPGNVDADELAVLHKTIEALKKQHPYLKVE